MSGIMQVAVGEKRTIVVASGLGNPGYPLVYRSSLVFDAR